MACQRRDVVPCHRPTAWQSKGRASRSTGVLAPEVSQLVLPVIGCPATDCRRKRAILSGHSDRFRHKCWTSKGRGSRDRQWVATNFPWPSAHTPCLPLHCHADRAEGPRSAFCCSVDPIWHASCVHGLSVHLPNPQPIKRRNNHVRSTTENVWNGNVRLVTFSERDGEGV